MARIAPDITSFLPNLNLVAVMRSSSSADAGAPLAAASANHLASSASVVGKLPNANANAA